MLIGRHHAMAGGRTAGFLERSAYLLLSRIEAQGPMSIGQLAEAFQLDTSTVNRQAAAMLRAGVVERIPDPDGGVARKFAITAVGSEALTEDRRRHQEGLGRVLKGWSDAEVAGLATVLTRLNRSIEDLQGVVWPRG
ncbi:MarR family winged helix-turn-helix transcriptional regulator [Kitasatospora sp. NPDC091207]|uniref:MarR family winged helix-turn-helix transcriptional regulator n=1 Tax=Kitasatospora sp. NPDC091207 TaxID=3364083 RepID=UPI0038041261